MHNSCATMHPRNISRLCQTNNDGPPLQSFLTWFSFSRRATFSIWLERLRGVRWICSSSWCFRSNTRKRWMSTLIRMILYKMNNYMGSLSNENDLDRRNQQNGKRKEERNEEAIQVKVIGLWEVPPVPSTDHTTSPAPSSPRSWVLSLRTPKTNPPRRR